MGTEGFYPPKHTLEAGNPERWAPTLVHRLGAAARRLAPVLNASLGQR